MVWESDSSDLKDSLGDLISWPVLGETFFLRRLLSIFIVTFRLTFSNDSSLFIDNNCVNYLSFLPSFLIGSHNLPNDACSKAVQIPYLYGISAHTKSGNIDVGITSYAVSCSKHDKYIPFGSRKGSKRVKLSSESVALRSSEKYRV